MIYTRIKYNVHVILHDDALILYFFKKSKFAM